MSTENREKSQNEQLLLFIVISGLLAGVVFHLLARLSQVTGRGWDWAAELLTPIGTIVISSFAAVGVRSLVRKQEGLRVKNTVETVLDSQLSALDSRLSVSLTKVEGKFDTIERAFEDSVACSLRPLATKMDHIASIEEEGRCLRPKWDNEVFEKTLKEVEHSPDDDADLRILTTIFYDVVDKHLHLQELVEKNCRIQVLFTNHENKSLIKARYMLRTAWSGKDETPEQQALDKLEDQIHKLRNVIPVEAKKRKPGNTGTIEVRESDVMPCAFLVMSRKRILFGGMLAHLAYDEGGPMVEVRPENAELWTLLNDDWKERWTSAEREAQRRTDEAVSISSKTVPFARREHA